MPLKAGVLFLCSVSIIRGLSSDQPIPNRRIKWYVLFGNCLLNFLIFLLLFKFCLFICVKSVEYQKQIQLDEPD